jgi:DNA-binding protein WhiA
VKRSFSSSVREELCGLKIESRHCALAELAAFLINVCGIKPDGITLRTEQPHIRRRYVALMEFIFKPGTPPRNIVSAAGAGVTVSPVVLMASCCKQAYIRGSFITGGTISDPTKNYHMEFIYPNNEALAGQLQEILLSFGINAKTRSSHSQVFIKEAEDIVETLRITGASKSLLTFENTRVTKEIANTVNRRVNFETANINKTVSAAVSQRTDIEFIAEHMGLSTLAEPLQEVAKLRLKYETASLQEIGGMLKEPVSKSGVNHRLRRISEIAEGLRREDERGSKK